MEQIHTRVARTNERDARTNGQISSDDQSGGTPAIIGRALENDGRTDGRYARDGRNDGRLDGRHARPAR